MCVRLYILRERIVRSTYLVCASPLLLLLCYCCGDGVCRCFNTLTLPVYTDPDVVREKLLIAIREGSEGFGQI